MNGVHFSARELEAMVARAALGHQQAHHLHVCEQCHFLLALVRRARGEPSDEQREVTMDALKDWAAS